MAISLPYLFIVGKGAQNLLSGIAYVAILGTFLIIIFSAFSMGLSSRVKSMKNSLMVTFFIFLLAGAPIFLSAAQRRTWFGKILDFINPFACAINTFDSVVIDSQGPTYHAGRVVPLTLFTLDAWDFVKLTRSSEEAGKQKQALPHKWVFYFLMAVGFWNFVGAGIFGFLINLPIISYFEIGTLLTPNHGHAALMGVFRKELLSSFQFQFYQRTEPYAPFF